MGAGSSLRTSVLLSIGVHALCVIGCALLLIERASKTASRSEQVFIEIVPTPAQQEALKKRLARKDDTENSRRIVQTSQGRRVEEAAPDAFLGEKTQIVDRQTVSSDRNTRMGRDSERERKKAGARDPKKTATLAKFGLGLPSPTKRLPGQDLADDSGRWAGPTGDSLPTDYVYGFRESDRTALNTKEYVFYGYFQRIRQRLDLAWEGILRDHLIKRYKYGRALASNMDHRTRCLVTLDAKGEVVRVQVVEESGTRELDDAAVKAFNKAGPFPNPPRGIVDASGRIQIRWDFVLRS